MKTKYDIHPDFAKFLVITLKFSPLIIGLINSFMKLQRALTKRSYALDVQKHEIASADGSRFYVIVMTPAHLQKPAPALIIYHGGAFALSYASTHLETC